MIEVQIAPPASMQVPSAAMSDAVSLPENDSETISVEFVRRYDHAIRQLDPVRHLANRAVMGDQRDATAATRRSRDW